MGAVKCDTVCPEVGDELLPLGKGREPGHQGAGPWVLTPESADYRDYLKAMAAGANFAIVNRLAMFEQIAAFQHVFGQPL